MSKIGAKPVEFKENVQVDISESNVKVKGPKGELSLDIPTTKIKIEVKDNKVILTRNVEDNEAKAQHGLYNTLIKNMVKGVSDGFERTLDLVGVGYRVQKKGEGLSLALGYSHPIEVEPIKGISFELVGDTKIIVRGIDKQLVGQVSANIRKFRLPEPYKGKGVKYSDERIIRKAGKSAKK
ncbi:MAG: 50S ribosomal protein L6 [Candidatus Margulisbacteria bacterium]|nr:50S ribosomal protein L6 [Candidatus Margulisiibacteriota bacterium]